MKSKAKWFFGHTAAFSAGLCITGVPCLVKFLEKPSVRLMKKENELNAWLENTGADNSNFFNFGFEGENEYDVKCDHGFEKYEIKSKGGEKIFYDVCISQGKTLDEIEEVLGEQFEDFKKIP